MAETKAAPKQDRFAAWVRQYGVSRLMRDLGKSSRTFIHDWFKSDPSKRHFPEADMAAVLMWLSQEEPLKEDGLPLTWDDIFGELAAAAVKHYLSGFKPTPRAEVVAASLARQQSQPMQGSAS